MMSASTLSSIALRYRDRLAGTFRTLRIRCWMIVTEPAGLIRVCAWFDGTACSQRGRHRLHCWSEKFSTGIDGRRCGPAKYRFESTRRACRPQDDVRQPWQAVPDKNRQAFDR